MNKTLNNHAMRKVLLLICLLISFGFANAQNLVLNPSFESYSNCPQGPGAINVVTNWSNPDTATSDYYNSCHTVIAGFSVDVPSNSQGWQQARTGNGYAGLIAVEQSFGLSTNYREYIQGQLSAPLQAGQQYCVSFFWSLSNKSVYTSQNLGVYFSNTQVFLQQSTALPFTPQVSASGTYLNDTTNWVLFSGTFTATGGEQFLIIGNFNNPANTVSTTTGVPSDVFNTGGDFAYYYIEDVSVTQSGICCIADVGTHAPVCTDETPFTLYTSTSGGTWSGPGITNASTGLFDPSVAGSGTHTVTYTLSCGSSASTSIVVNSCAALEVCVESNGDVTVSGGTGPYTWFEGDTVSDCSGCLFPFLCAPPGCAVLDTTYTQFTTGATATPPSGWLAMKVVDSQSNELLITTLTGIPSCGGCSLTAQITEQLNVSCFGGNNGTATVQAQNSGGNETYVWSTNPSQSGSTATGLAAGTYTVTITDDNQCSGTATVTITQPTSALSASLTPTNPTCSTQGSISVSAQGGTASYSYLWSQGGTGTSITGLAAGTYTVTVTDQNTCTTTQNVTLSSGGSQPSASIDEQFNVPCHGGSDGWVTIGVNGGTPNYNITWNTTPAQSGITANDLSAGTYTASITDQNSCATSITVVITEPAEELALTTGSTASQCGSPTGSATVTASGGTAGYNYIWNTTQGGNTLSNVGAGTYTVTVTDANTCTAVASVAVSDANAPTIGIIAYTDPTCAGSSNGTASAVVSGGTGTSIVTWNTNPVQTGTAVTGLPAGTYIATAVDQGGCQSSETVTLVDPLAITASAAATNPGCGDPTGEVAVTPTGGTSPYTYSWNVSQSGATAQALSAGTYTCTVTDANGCTTTVSETLSAPVPVTTDVTIAEATCALADGGIQLDPSGGSGQYTYLWCDNNGTASSISNVPGGSYCVTINDGNGCTFDTTIVIGTTNFLEITVVYDAGNNLLTASANQTTGVTYQWYYGGQPIQGAFGPTYTPTESGVYYAVGSTKEGCEDESSALEIGVQDGIEEEILQQLNVFPNPANDQLMIVGELIGGETLAVDIYAATGQLVYTNEYESLSGNISIPVYQYSEGIYLMKFSIGSNVRLEKIIIKR